MIVVGSGLGRGAPPPMPRGIEIINLPLSANGAASILFDIVSFFKVRSRVDAILILGVSAGLFVPLFRLLSGRVERVGIELD